MQGLATYIDDLPLIEGTLHAAPILSQKARGRITLLDVSAVRSSEGVVAVVSADDIPGDRLLATFVHDEPVFATDEVQHIGQVLGLVVADSHVNARAAASKAVLEVKAQSPMLDARAAAAKGHTVLPAVKVQRGDAATEIGRAHV